MVTAGKVYFFVMVFLYGFTSYAYAGISPSQVLVLYNADWTGDNPLTDKGQDSKEIAEYYVKMHTNEKTGEKPYILGLSGGCAKLLNKPHLKEKSHDNKSGVILTNLKKMIGSTYKLRDSRLVEFKLPKTKSGWQFDSLKMQLGLKNSKISNRLTIIEKGENLFPNRVLLRHSGKFNVRLNGRGFLSGSLVVTASCKDNNGEIHRWKAFYHDISDTRFSKTGPDGIRDDKNYLKYIETPVKNFLENPDNALKDGTLLKDHILYFVICYGLPKTCISNYGIERGITNYLHNFGSIIDLGQRLQLMYYDFDKITGSAPHPHKFDSNQAFTAYYIRAPEAFPLYGPKANPFLHPDVYKKKINLNRLIPLSFTSVNRKKHTARLLYFAMRMDGSDPVQAKSLIDRSVFAQKYSTPDMGVAFDEKLIKSKDTTGTLKYNKAGIMLWNLGFRRIYYRYTSSNRLEMFRLPAGKPFYNKSPVYLPGGIATEVISNSGWNRKNAAIYRYLNRGVTITMGAAKVYEGAPHIHDKSFWDDDILYTALRNGKTIGEALLMNQAHLGWIAGFVGDPLYRLSGNKERQKPALKISRIRIIPLKNKSDRTALMVILESGKIFPPMAQMRIRSTGKSAPVEYICDTFEARPYVILRNEDLMKNKTWLLSFIDPFGNETKKNVDLSKL